MLHIKVYDENPRWWFGFLNKEAFRQTTDHDGIILIGELGKDFRVAIAKDGGGRVVGIRRKEKNEN